MHETGGYGKIRKSFELSSLVEARFVAQYENKSHVDILSLFEPSFQLEKGKNKSRTNNCLGSSTNQYMDVLAIKRYLIEIFLFLIVVKRKGNSNKCMIL